MFCVISNPPSSPLCLIPPLLNLPLLTLLPPQCVSRDDAVATGATLPVSMTMPFSPLSSDEEHQRMLGNNRHLYPGAEEEEEEEEESVAMHGSAL